MKSLKTLYLINGAFLFVFFLSCSRNTHPSSVVYETYAINILDFGAIPNDGKDDSEAIQAAIDYAIENLKSSKIYCPPGIYDLDKGVLIAKRNNKEYDFITMTFSGHIPTYSGNQNLGSTTVYRLKNPTFGIAVQSARNIVIENIVFEGCALYSSDIQKIYSNTQEDWSSKAKASNNSFSPSCAVVIDPFHAAVPQKDRYQHFESMYTNQSNRGSSMILIRGCSFFKHYIAIANNPSNGVQNGDNIRAEQCHVNTCHTFWSAGQTQSRGNSIDNIYALFLHTLVSGVQIGKQQGSPPTVSNVNLAGFCKMVFDIKTGFSGLNVYRSYFESVWSLGVSNGISTSFDQCQIKFHKPDANVAAPPFHIYSDRVVSFRDCSLAYFDNCNTPIPFLMRSKELLISGGQIEGGVIVADGITNAGGDDLHKVQLEGVFIKCLGKVAGKKTTMKPESKVRNEIIMGGEVIMTNEGEMAVNNTTTYDLNHLEKALVTHQNNQMTYTSSKPHEYSKGDNLFSANDIETKTVGLGNFKIRSYLGYVSDISKNTIAISGAPAGTQAGSHQIYKVAYPTFDFINSRSNSEFNNIIKYRK